MGFNSKCENGGNLSQTFEICCIQLFQASDDFGKSGGSRVSVVEPKEGNSQGAWHRLAMGINHWNEVARKAHIPNHLEAKVKG